MVAVMAEEAFGFQPAFYGFIADSGLFLLINSVALPWDVEGFEKTAKDPCFRGTVDEGFFEELRGDQSFAFGALHALADFSESQATGVDEGLDVFRVELAELDFGELRVIQFFDQPRG